MVIEIKLKKRSTPVRLAKLEAYKIEADRQLRNQEIRRSQFRKLQAEHKKFCDALTKSLKVKDKIEEKTIIEEVEKLVGLYANSIAREASLVKEVYELAKLTEEAAK